MIKSCYLSSQAPFQGDCTRHVAIWTAAILNGVNPKSIRNYDSLLSKYFDPFIKKGYGAYKPIIKNSALGDLVEKDDFEQIFSSERMLQQQSQVVNHDSNFSI
ncbi:hypothetical protein [Fastidiosibacter lacustris]|uniref:hypothetical protein n=1 Tax=Fastidiosibacter lacustris TaxID=2056695 RepID=UPI000E342DA6|nr:hypothetical protein [Fastidiosibacter lacustris]